MEICLLPWETLALMDNHSQGINTHLSLGEHEGSGSAPRLKGKQAARAGQGRRRLLWLTACPAEVTRERWQPAGTGARERKALEVGLCLLPNEEEL